MDALITWVGDNKEWLFSGAGIAGIAIAAQLLLKRRSGGTQSIRSGHSSTNLQAGGDINVQEGRKSDGT